MSRKKLNPTEDLPKLTPCAARLIELLLSRLPELKKSSEIRLGYAKEGMKAEVEYYSPSPSGELQMWIETTPENVQLRFAEQGKAGHASAIFFMHPVNFHRTSEAAVDFIDKVSQGQIIVARTHKRTFPFFGHKRMRFYEVGEIVGGKAAEIEKVFVWRRLNITSN